jgi:hypothetical protein
MSPEGKNMKRGKRKGEKCERKRKIRKVKKKIVLEGVK